MSKFNNYDKGWYIVHYGLEWTCDFFDGEVWINQSEVIGGRYPHIAPLGVYGKVDLPADTPESKIL